MNGFSRRFAAFIALATIAAFPVFPDQAFSLSIEEALSLAESRLPSYQASREKVRSSEELYKASLGPYFPTLDAAAIPEYHETEPSSTDVWTYDVTLAYTLFDGGKRRAGRNIAGLNLESSREDALRSLQELQFGVKTAFYTAIARHSIVEERKSQLKLAEKDHEVAQGRHRLEVAKLSDVLQASVRLEQAKFNLTQGKGLFSNSMAELNSLIGRPLDTHYDLEGDIIPLTRLPSLDVLRNAALSRPEIKQAENAVMVSKNNKTIETSSFYPTLSAVASYDRTEFGFVTGDPNEDKSVGLRLTWNIFELGKFYRRRSAEFDINVSMENLKETKRQLLLNLDKAVQDFKTASRNIGVAEEQLKQAEQNYSQAFGEYKVGKSDILALVQAEIFLSSSREQLIGAKLNLVLSRALLERATGMDRLEALISPEGGF